MRTRLLTASAAVVLLGSLAAAPAASAAPAPATASVTVTNNVTVVQRDNGTLGWDDWCDAFPWWPSC